MLVFNLLKILNSSIEPAETKIHLATWNGIEDPLDVNLAGDFNKWQREQTKKNFQRKFVVSLINLPGKDRWLFGGVHYPSNPVWNEIDQLYYYDMAEDQACT